MHPRKRLHDKLVFLADQNRKACPFAASVLRSLAGAMELDIDRPLSEAVLEWMILECRVMDDDLQRAIAEAHEQARERRRKAVVQLFDDNADVPADPTLN